MKKPEVGDLVVAWDTKKRVDSYKGYALGTLIRYRPASEDWLPFQVKKANVESGTDPHEWFDEAQTITPDQVKDVINGVWKPVEEPKLGDLVVAWDWEFDTDTLIRIGIFKDFHNPEETRYPYRVSYSQERMDSEGFQHVQKISPEEIPNIFKEGWKPRGY